MADDGAFSPDNDNFLNSSNIGITIEGSPTGEQLLDDGGNDLEDGCEQIFEIDEDENKISRSAATVIEGHHNGKFLDKEYPPPVVAMEFDSYEGAYNYYNSYSKELGFAIRVKSSWTKRNSKEKRGAVLCCNCEGFKTSREASSHRKETRTGCGAMIRLRLVESNKWRVDEVKLEHNHLFDPERAQNSKSHKRMNSGSKRKLEPSLDVEVRTIKLYRTPMVDEVGYGNTNCGEGESSSPMKWSRHLKLQKGDLEVISNYFCQVQLTDPNFFYVMDLNDDGRLRNVFWIDSRSRAAYGYFGDVVAFDTTCLSNNYEIPLFAFVGLNHHQDYIILGAALLADETLETYIWLFRAWLTCMYGRPPQTIISMRCKAMQNAIAEVFPRAQHRICSSYVIQRILGNLGSMQNSEEFQMALSRTMYDSTKIDEFETAWDDMMQRFSIRDHDFLQAFYEERENWVPVYSKDTFFAGILGYHEDESSSPLFKEYVNRHTSLKEFFDAYELFLQMKRKKEACDDLESRDSSPMLKTRFSCELQVSKLYTNGLFVKFQDEVVMMASCFSITQIHANGQIVTYMVKERREDDIVQDIRNFEVMYDKAGEVRCICSCFQFKGYLCRHALCVLNYNGMEEIPSQYILSRWRKDFRRLYVPDLGSNTVDIANPVQRFDHLYRFAMQVAGQGMISNDHCMVAWQALKETLNKVRLVADSNVETNK